MLDLQIQAENMLMTLKYLYFGFFFVANLTQPAYHRLKSNEPKVVWINLIVSIYFGALLSIKTELLKICIMYAQCHKLGR